MIIPDSIQKIKNLNNPEAFSNIDLFFADFIIKMAKSKNPILFLTAAMASYSVRKGHICTNLYNYFEQPFPEIYSNPDLNNSEQICLPDSDQWQECINSYPAIIGNGKIKTPLVLDDNNRLYLYKYWKYEQKLATMIFDKARKNVQNKNASKVIEISKKPGKVDYQQIAIFAALKNYFTVITGGPGTGKTTIVTSILAKYFSQNPSIKIGLCAPTGKAAARLKESIREEVKNLKCSDEIKNKISNLDSSTIHRLLGVKYNTPFFRHNEENKLALDLLILDEASMVSLDLMCKLLQAIKIQTKVILLGDKDQLSSVEAGAVLGDICDTFSPNYFSKNFIKEFENSSSTKIPKTGGISRKHAPLNCIVELQKSYRFDDQKGIGNLKKTILLAETSQSSNNVLSILNKKSEEISFSTLPERTSFEQKIIDKILNININIDKKDMPFISYLQTNDIKRKYLIFSSFRILCSHRKGIFGVENVNRIITEYLLQHEPFPDGLPVMVLENDKLLKLYNGDIGIVQKEENGQKRVYFPNTEKPGLFRSFSPAQLPKNEAVFAMTIHKSQGSGFQKTLIILPDRDSQILTKELIYTGVTRSQKLCEIWAKESIIKNSVQRKIKRDSGLNAAFLKLTIN